MTKRTNLLTRKLGPLPAWVWAVAAGAAVYWYRNRQASSSTSGTLGYTGPIPGAQGATGATGPAGPAGPVGVVSRKHHPKPRKRKTRDGHHRKRRKHHEHRGGHHTDHASHGHEKAQHHHSGAQHEHRAKPKRVIGKGRGSHVTHSGVHHEAHGHRQVRNEPHEHTVHPPGAGQKARGRVPGHKAALTSASPVPRGEGRPRVGHSLSGASSERGLPTHTATSPHVRNRIAEPPAQGHVRRQAAPSRAERPIVTRGGRQPDHAAAARTPHTTSKQAGQPSRTGSRHVRRRAE